MNVNDISFQNTTNSITFKYLTNSDKYKQILKHQTTEPNIINNKNRKFYRKRFMYLTKKMYKNEIDIPILKGAFDAYLNSVFEYFQTTDYNKEIKDLNSTVIDDNEMDDSEDSNIKRQSYEKKSKFDLHTMDANAKMAQKTHRTPTLDNFVVKSKERKQEKYPQKKKINLYDSKFKKKKKT